MVTVPNVDIVTDIGFIMRWTQFVQSICPQLDEWECTKHSVCTVLSFSSVHNWVSGNIKKTFGLYCSIVFISGQLGEWKQKKNIWSVL